MDALAGYVIETDTTIEEYFSHVDEDFKAIDNHKDYYITDIGRVVSTKHNKIRIMKLNITNKGYVQVGIGKNKKTCNYSVHSLVAKYFIGERPSGYQINHIDGVKTNNNVANLEYVTPQENSIHAHKNGLIVHKKGEKHHLSKLSDKDCFNIRLLYSKNKAEILSYFYGVSSTHIRKIANREARF